MEQTVEKKKGNPNFGKKATQDFNEIEDINKVYQFILCQTYERYKPVDKDSGYTSTAPYPPKYQLPSEGVTLDDESKRMRRWRCLRGIDTIWVDEQDGMEPQGFEDYEMVEFTYGKLNVRAFEKNKLAVLLNFDGFEGKKNRRNDISPVYRLIDEQKDLNNQLSSLDLEYEALKTANECSDEEMIPFAYVLGINVQQSTKAIRRDFIGKAKSNPSYFVKYFVDPKNKIAYVVYDGIQKGLISASGIEGKLIWSESQKVIMDAPKGSNVAQDIAKLVMKGNEDAINLVEQLKKM
jgi:hypothetical protein